MAKSLEAIKKTLRSHKEELKEKYGVIETGIFGSYVRGEQKKSSDVDVLVEFEKPVSLLRLVEVENYLSDLLKTKVDLVPKEDVRPELKNRILQEVVRI